MWNPTAPGIASTAPLAGSFAAVVKNAGRRFADYVVADGEFARAPFLHDAGDLGLYVVARLKNNLPELFAAAQKRFRRQPPHQVFRHGQDRVEIWDADDFDPWETLRWETVRVIRYRQYKPNGKVFEAYWLTDFPRPRVSSRTLFHMAKSRWEIENQGFNDAKNRYGFEHICHHERHSLLAVWLLTCLALTLERLYRVRYLHRGTHPVRAAIDLLLLLATQPGNVAAHRHGLQLKAPPLRSLRFPLFRDPRPEQLLVLVSAQREKPTREIGSGDSAVTITLPPAAHALIQHFSSYGLRSCWIAVDSLAFAHILE